MPYTLSLPRLVYYWFKFHTISRLKDVRPLQHINVSQISLQLPVLHCSIPAAFHKLQQDVSLLTSFNLKSLLKNFSSPRANRSLKNTQQNTKIYPNALHVTILEMTKCNKYHI